MLVTELFIRGRKLNIPFVSIIQSYFAAQKNIRLNSTHEFTLKISDATLASENPLRFRKNLLERI